MYFKIFAIGLVVVMAIIGASVVNSSQDSPSSSVSAASSSSGMYTTPEASINFRANFPSADDLKSLVGKKFVEEAGAGIQSTVPFITRNQLPEKNRVVRPGQFVTMDFDTERVTLSLDDNDIIVKAKIG